MAERVGRGATFGAALRAAFGPRLRRTPAVSWEAKLNQLTATGRGQDVLAKHAAPGRGGRNWAGWLSGEVRPNARSQARISAAYDAYLGRSEAVHHGAGVRIYGVVDLDNGEPRDRGGPRYMPLRVNHFNANEGRHGGKWGPFDAAVTGDTPVSDADLEDLYAYDVMGADDALGWSGDGPAFPGAAYVVVVEG